MANTARSPIAGHNIYLNEHNQKVLFDPITKTGYLIRETEAQKFTLYHNRWILALAIGILVYSFTDKIPLSILTSFLYGAIQKHNGPILIGFEVIVMIATSWKAIQYFIAFYKLLKLKKKH